MQSDSRPYGEKQNQEDREQIVVRPSPEFIPDEYHFSIEKVRVDIFRNPQDASISQKLIETFQLIGYSVDIDSNVHDLNSSTNLKNDLDSIKESIESNQSEALVLLFIGDSNGDGTFEISSVNKDGHEYITHISIKQIWNHFSGNNCSQLRLKPKVFMFFPITPVKVEPRVQQDGIRRFSFDQIYDFPAESDILIIYGRHIAEGSTKRLNEAFFDQFCDNIKTRSKRHDIIDLIIHTEGKSVPILISTLTRRFYMTISEERGFYLDIRENQINLNQGLEKIKARIEAQNRNNGDRKVSFRNTNKPNAVRASTSSRRKNQSESDGADAPRRTRTTSSSSNPQRPPWKHLFK